MPPLPFAAGSGPSLGCTMTDPSPCSWSWNISPEPPLTKDLIPSDR